MFGIDVSENNGTINWDLVKTNNPKIDFAYIKSSEGVGFTDHKLNINATGAKKAGIKIGYYHFASLNNLDVIHDAESEANYFLSAIAKLPANDLPLILDLETNKIGLSPERNISWIKEFFQVLCDKNKTCAIYSYTPFLNQNLPNGHGLGNIPLWIAQYSTKDVPVLPKEWSEYWIWQYTNKGKINGIIGNVDLNKTKI